jgi:hypothetical protein
MATLAPRKTKSLRDEIRQSKPFDSPAQEAILALYRTSDMLRRRFSQLVEPHGISLQQYNVLRILRGAGKAGTPTLDIADRMIEMTPGVTRRFCAGSRRQGCDCWLHSTPPWRRRVPVRWNRLQLLSSGRSSIRSKNSGGIGGSFF